MDRKAGGKNGGKKIKRKNEVKYKYNDDFE